jgi:hypothetical protein
MLCVRTLGLLIRGKDVGLYSKQLIDECSSIYIFEHRNSDK